MKISYQWLRQHLHFTENAEEVGKLLTSTGLEVEAITDFESIKGGLRGIIVGEVITCEKHPNADKLKITTVNIGNDTLLPIVCGAPNVAAGQKVAVATIGTILYDKEGNPFEIKKGKIRGEASHGMICAEDELGLGDNHDGILILDNNTTIGIPLAHVLKIENDHTLEIGLTPNRADAMGHYGVARDLKAVLKQQKGIDITLNLPKYTIDETNHQLNITVQEPELCSQYTAIQITNITVQPSPEWLQNRLKAIGLKPINNVVDATNYILHDLGQPLHAFDLDKITEGKIIIRKAIEGEKFTTLDGIERTLSKEDLIIADSQKPMCLAGTMGGIDSGVSATTTNIILEAAYFDAISVRKTAKRHAINSDSSFRFERGIDPNMTLYALQKAANLLVEITGGTINSTVFISKSKEFAPFTLSLKNNSLVKLIGETIPKETIETILTSLEINFKAETDGWQLSVPPYRVDVQREADVIEEILRIYGFNTIKNPEKLNTSIIYSDQLNPHNIWNTTANYLASAGFNEMINNSLQKNTYQELTSTINPNESVYLLNPLSQDLGSMRQSLLWGGLEVIAYNNNRKKNDLKLFEIGKTYHKIEGKYIEKQKLSLLICGNRQAENWHKTNFSSSFYYGKAILENILKKLGINNYNYETTENDIYSDALSLKSNKKEIAQIGWINNSLLQKFDINQAVLSISIDWEALLFLVKNRPSIQFKELPKYPSSRKDLALLVDQSITYQQLYTLAFQTERKLLKSVNLFDVYEGKNLPEGKKSYALSFELQDTEKTLQDKIIEKTMQKLINTYEKEVNAILRS